MSKSEKNSFVIKDVSDHWKDYTYHQRYLDGLASIFALQRPVAAVAYFPTTKKFYLSYNAYDSKSTIYKKLNKQIDIIQKKLKSLCEIDKKDQIDPIVESLLFMYIAYNCDFKNNLSKDYKIFKNPDIYNIKVNSSNILQIKLEDLNKHVDNIKQTEQEQLDKEKEIKKEINSLVKTINDIFKCQKVIDPENIKSLKEKQKEETISNNDQNLIRKCDEAIKNYNTLLNLLKVDKNYNKSDEFFKLAEVLLRPLQDIEKVLYYLKHQNIKFDLEVIDNHNSAHAEVNLGKEFVHEKDFYIGVSRLCCGICDYVLDDIYHLKHRGTHGTGDDGWKAPAIQFEKTFEKLREKSIGFDQSTLQYQVANQHKRLSHDDLQSLLKIQLDKDAPNKNIFQYQKHKDILLTGETDITISESRLFNGSVR